MRRSVLCVVALVLVAGLATLVKAQSAADSENAFKLALYYLDMSIDSLGKADNAGAISYLNSALIEYNNFSVKNVDNALDSRIRASFSSLSQTPVEENIRVLRADVSLAAGKLGISIPETSGSFPWWILPVVLAVALAVGLVAYLRRSG